MPKRLAVIGGGPKAAAIAAKASCLRDAGYDPPDVTIYAEFGVGSMWTGLHGYTDGEQPLCTPSERDLGFPYDTSAPVADVAHALFKRFSWQSYLVSGVNPPSYKDWIVGGRAPAKHRDFAHYIRNAVSGSGAEVVEAKVQGINHTRWEWVVQSSDPANTRREFDGIVITGIGPPFAHLPGSNHRVVNAKDFWLPQQQILIASLLATAGEDARVAIIGGGGTAAAVARWFLMRESQALPITIIGHEATLFTRTAGPFEDRLFSDEAEWDSLAPHTRARFIERVTRATVWEPIVRMLGSAQNVHYRSASVQHFRPPTPSTVPTDEIVAVLSHPRDSTAIPSSATAAVLPPAGEFPATVFIDARGFDSWWFTDLLPAPSPLRSFFSPQNRVSLQQGNIDRNLQLTGLMSTGDPIPDGLHLPNLAGCQGPAAPNLMALGWVADRILRPYLGSVSPFVSAYP